jgi:hypothetical protein
LVVKRNPTRGQRFDNLSYIDFWSARDTNMKIRKGKFDEFLQKLKHLFPRRWNPRRVRRLIECVYDQVGWTLIGEFEHPFQAFCQITITGLVLSLVVRGKEI